MKKTMTGLAILATLALTGLAAGPALADDTPAPTQEVASSPDTSTTADQPTAPAPQGPGAAATPTTPTSDTAESGTPLQPSSDAPSRPTEPLTSAGAASSASPSQAVADKGHTPVTICHQPGTPAQQTLTVDDNALKGHLKHGDTLGECAPLPQPVEGWWLLPDGGTPDNVTWPQAATPANTVPCGVWAQVDTYPSQAALDKLAADGVLTLGEDYGIAQSWRFVYGGDCPPPAPGPANPAATIDASCGLAHVVLTNDGEDILTASLVVYVDGDFYQAYAIAAGDHQQVSISFGEDTGTHTVEVRTGPAFGDQQVAIREDIASDCEQTPPTSTPTDTPTTTPTPEVTPSATPQAQQVAVAPVSEVTSKLADTGSKSELGAWPAAVAIIILILGLLFLLFGRGKKKASK